MQNIAKAYAISDAKISFVSLVDKAANKKQFLITKGADGSASFTSYGRIIKADSESHFVTGIVYEPMVEDTQGNYMTADEIAKAAHWFMKNQGSVDIQHCFQKADGVEVVESFLLSDRPRCTDERHYQEENLGQIHRGTDTVLYVQHTETVRNAFVR